MEGKLSQAHLGLALKVSLELATLSIAQSGAGTDLTSRGKEIGQMFNDILREVTAGILEIQQLSDMEPAGDLKIMDLDSEELTAISRNCGSQVGALAAGSIDSPSRNFFQKPKP